MTANVDHSETAEDRLPRALVALTGVIAGQRPLPEVLEAIVRTIERQSEGITGSVLLLDADEKHLVHGAAPGLPPPYVRAIDGTPIGPKAGSCGTAAHLNERVIVEDVVTDPLWEDYRDLALEHGLRACWSQPIVSKQGRVLGTFALYYRRPRRPTGVELTLIEAAAHLASIAIERREAERALLREHDLLQSLMDSVPDAIYFKDHHSRFTRVNRAQARFLGVAHPNDAIGRSDEEFFPPTAAGGYRADEQQIIRTGEPVIGRIEHNGRDGAERRWFSTTKVPLFGADGSIDGTVGISRDISDRMQLEEALVRARDEVEARVHERTTELSETISKLRKTELALRESQEHFRQLAENIREVFWLVDWPGVTVIYASRAYESIWGQPLDALYENAADWIDAIHPEDRARVHGAFLHDAPAGTFDEVYRVVRPDGSVRWIRDRGFPIRSEKSDEIYRIAGIAEDITEQKQTEEQAKQHQAELARLTQLSTLVVTAASFSHELNQPLQVIMMRAHACQHELEKEPIDRGAIASDLELIVKQTQRTDDIMRRLRGIVREEPARHEPTDVNAAVQSAVRWLEPLAEQNDVTIRASLSRGILVAAADRLHVEQVLLNLGHNAVEAMRDPGVTERTLTFETAQSGDNAIEITVSDTGPGLPIDFANRAFEPFVSSKPNGLGLGLPLARQLVHAHRGSLTVDRRNGSGAQFKITLPTATPGSQPP